MGRKSQELLGYVLSYSGKPGGPYFGMQVKPKRWGAHELEEAQDVCRVTQEDFPAARILRLTPNRKRAVTQELVESAMQMAVTLESAIGSPKKDLHFHGLECGKYLSKLQAACIAYIKLEVEKGVKKPALLSVGGLMSSKPTSNDTYKIVKFTFNGPPKAVRGKRGLSLAEAQAHCQRPDVAVSLGSDLCAEYEWGIKPLRRYFECDDDGDGVTSRLTRTVPAALTWFKGENFEGIFLPSWSGAKPPTPAKGTVTWGAWDESSFGVFSEDPKVIKKLLVIYEAIKSNDAVIWLGGGGVFDNAGLCIGVASNLPTEVKQAWKKTHEDRKALLKAAEATGIADRIKAAGLKYFALSPRLATDGTVQFLLNPQQQDIYNSMLCTVADLDAWIQGKGPVVKTKKQQRSRW